MRAIMLMATLASLSQIDMNMLLLGEPLIDNLRYNTGYISQYSPKETIEKLVDFMGDSLKNLYIDIEGRQLRVDIWSHPKNGGKVSLNRAINVTLPARIKFRHDRWCDISFVNGKNIFLSTMPKHAIGNGQTVNIDAEAWEVEGGYLSPRCKEYIEAAVEQGIRHFCLSFIESWKDVGEVEEVIRKVVRGTNKDRFELVLKIESKKGLIMSQNFHSNDCGDSVFVYRLMLARDDLYTNLKNDSLELLRAAEFIFSRNKKAILASLIFESLRKDGQVSPGDLADLIVAKEQGYTNFMLADDISPAYLEEFIDAYKRLLNYLPKER